MRNNNFTKIKFYNNKDMVYSRLIELSYRRPDDIPIFAE